MKLLIFCQSKLCCILGSPSFRYSVTRDHNFSLFLSRKFHHLPSYLCNTLQYFSHLRLDFPTALLLSGPPPTLCIKLSALCTCYLPLPHSPHNVRACTVSPALSHKFETLFTTDIRLQ